MRACLGIAAIAAAMGLVWPTPASADEPHERDRDSDDSRDARVAEENDEVDFEAEARFWNFDNFGQSIVIGRPLGGHVSVLTGLAVSVLSLEQTGDDVGYVQMRIPVELKVSLVRPAAETIVPTVRAGVWFTHMVALDALAEPSRGLGGALFGGVTYFFSRHFGAGIEAGLGVERTWLGDDSGTWLLATTWRGHFVLRV